MKSDKLILLFNLLNITGGNRGMHIGYSSYDGMAMDYATHISKDIDVIGFYSYNEEDIGGGLISIRDVKYLEFILFKGDYFYHYHTANKSDYKELSLDEATDKLKSWNAKIRKLKSFS